jgi:putative transposase
MSKRHACGLLDVSRATVRYQAHGREEESVRKRLLELAALRKRFGYRRLGLLLRREGMVVNHKRVYRLYREEGLSQRRRQRKRLTSEGHGPGELASSPDQVWSLDFMSDSLAPGRRLKLLTVGGPPTRASLWPSRSTRRSRASGWRACSTASSASVAPNRRRSSWTTGRR